ncbi:MAG: hypothetical protein ACI4EI_09725 [Muricoprocola sp.]
MEENNQYKKIRTIIPIVGILILAGALVIMSLGLIKGFLTGTQGNIVMGVALVLFWVLTDIIEPVVTHRFDHITNEQKMAYYKFILFDLAGYAGIAYFLFGVGQNSSGIFGAVVYAVVMKPKRDARDIFYGIKKPEEDSEEVSEEAEEPEELEGEEKCLTGEVEEEEE